MIDLTNKDYRALLNAMLDRVPDTFDKRDTSPIPTALGPAAWALEGFYLALYSVQGQAFIQTATGQNLDMLAVVAGISRAPATPAVRLGVFNTAVPVGARFSTINGENSINFTVTAETEAPNQFQLTAERVGSVGNEYTGAILPVTAVPGLTSAAITDILIPGVDEEDDEAFRTRIVTALNERPYGGNIASYREWVRNVDGTGPVQVWPTWNGGGTVKLSVMGADNLPASDALLTSVENAIDPPPNKGLGLGLATIGADVTVVAPESVSVNIAATVSLAPGYVIGQVQQPVETALETYMESVRAGWGTPVSTSSSADILYNADVYHARVIAAMLSVPGVLNVSDVMLNGAAADVALVQSEEVQQVPVLGTVTLNG